MHRIVFRTLPIAVVASLFGCTWIEDVDYANADYSYAADCLNKVKQNGSKNDRPEFVRIAESECYLGSNSVGMRIDAGAGDDRVAASPLDDIIIGGPDNDKLDGGPGVDLAAFSGQRAAYVITRTQNQVVVTGPDGADTLTNIEVLHFDDATLDLEAAVARSSWDGELRSIPVWYPDGTAQGAQRSQERLAAAFDDAGLRSSKETPAQKESNDVLETIRSGNPATARAALARYREIASAGDAVAEANLGFMYYQGLGVPRDMAEAAKWFRMAAQKGDVDSQHNIAQMLLTGDGIPPNEAEAARWFRAAAEKGNLEAATRLGALYSYGTGVPQNSAEAAKWFRKAADRGHAPAQLNLAIIYGKGEGVRPDYVEAYKWYSVVLRMRGPDLENTRNRASRNRTALAMKMDAADIERADKLARDWKPT